MLSIVLSDKDTELECICHQRRVLYPVGNTFSSTSPESTSSCLPSVDSVMLVCFFFLFFCFFCLFPDMRSTDTGIDLAIGNIGQGIVGHLGYCHRKHLVSYCLHLKPLPYYCESMAATPDKTSAFFTPLLFFNGIVVEKQAPFFLRLLRQVKIIFTIKKRIYLNLTVALLSLRIICNSFSYAFAECLTSNTSDSESSSSESP